jgi:hypothetical protein
MRILPEHAARMEAGIRAAIATAGPARIAEHKASVSPERFRWDLLYAAGLTRFVCDELYPYANDAHIDTALRHVMARIQAAPDGKGG